VQDALSNGEINLQEAAQLARLTSERLGCGRPRLAVRGVMFFGRTLPYRGACAPASRSCLARSRRPGSPLRAWRPSSRRRTSCWR
jgi:hypothetical protein